MKISIDYEGKIGEDYSIIRMLAIGGFGTVYLVKDNEKNIEYAAKTIDNDDSFKNEVQINEIVEKIDSLNIVKYISKGIKNVEYLGKSETKNYVVFEYCEYGDFFNYIPSGGFDEKVVKIVFKTLLEAVEKIHNKNVCHLDLKLENILVDKDFNLKISDFGLSNQINEINNGIFKKNCGTSYYKPPQMILGLSYNGIKADIVLVLFYLLYYQQDSFLLNRILEIMKILIIISKDMGLNFWNKYKIFFLKIVQENQDNYSLIWLHMKKVIGLK